MSSRTHRWTTDLLVVLVATVLATATVLFGPDGSLLRTALVAPVVLFLPGYALVSALFPERWNGASADERRLVSAPGSAGGGVSPVARVGLSVALSVALVPAVVLALEFTLGGLRVVASLFVLATLTVLLTLVALFRRARVSAPERFGVPPVTALLAAVVRPFGRDRQSLSASSTFRPTSKRGVALNVVLAVAIVAFASSIAVAYAYPTQGQQFTELYLVTESESGEFVASDYPREFSAGESRPVYAAVANHEGESKTYTLVATLQRVDQAPNGSKVTEERELTRVSRTVGAGETVRIRHELQPSFGDGRMRVQYLLYVGEAPADPSAGTAYRSVHLWISVDGGQAGGT